MKLEVGKTYLNTSKEKIKIVHKYDNGKFVGVSNNHSVNFCYDGIGLSGAYDLVLEIKPKQERWFNIYVRGISTDYQAEEYANNGTNNTDRIALIKLSWDIDGNVEMVKEE